MATIQASEIRVGDQVAERDGYLLKVEEIVRSTPKTVTLRFAPTMSARQGIVLTVRKSSNVEVSR